MLTTEAVLALAPDDASAKAARGLTSPAKWSTLGADDAAAWGECQGSGSKPYQTQVDLAGPAFRCSCPSRKFPCKHGLALLLMRAQDASRSAAPGRSEAPSTGLFTAPRPAWVDEWLASREQKDKQKEAREAQKAAASPPDPEAVAKREAKRWAGIEGAAQALERWLADQLARGLGALDDQALGGWRTMAARMVDAQAPGLGQRLLEAAAVVRATPDWPERLLHRLGLLHLACEGLQRRASLPADLQAELRTLAGWPFDKDEVLASGEAVDDRWCVIGVVTDERDGKLVERRVWLHGQCSARRAFVLDHAFGGRGFEQMWLPGTSVDATMRFFPGASRLRALAVNVQVVNVPSVDEPSVNVQPAGASTTNARLVSSQPAQAKASATAVESKPVDAAATPAGHAWPHGTSLTREWDRITQRVAASPWVWLHPLVLEDAVPARDGDGWRLVASNRHVRAKLDDGSAWLLMAAAAGHPLHCAGEWDGERFAPLLAWRDGAPQAVWTRAAT
jgi:hypothetical protein